MNAPPAPAPSEPFVGLRPYESHEGQLLKGREQDARFLADKVFASRLTLLYAPSGMGKSSLLRAKVIPALAEDGCRVAYHDAWAAGQPELALRQTLARAAEAAGLPAVLAADAPLVDWVRVATADGGTLVLVLDQFEEFLLNHANRLDPLRRELAALVRLADLDLRLLIALREEYLADLEPFRAQIVNLFSSTYRLEPLSREDVESAVRDPIEAYGRRCEAGLPQALLADLSTPVKGAAPGATLPPAVDLPMLQVVCLEMWRAAVARRREELTLDFYRRELGGAAAILDKFVRSKMPRGWFDRLFTARLMQLLAPPSGLKISYAVSDLVPLLGAPARRIERELERLADPSIRILRSRDYASGIRYELQHDALIPRIAPWRDECLALAQRLRRARNVGAAVLAVALFFVGRELYDRYELRRAADENFARLDCSAAVAPTRETAEQIDRATAFLIAHERTEAAWDLLRERLRRRAECIHPQHGRSDFDPYALQRAPESFEWPLVLQVSEDRPFDEQGFLQVWLRVAGTMTERYAVPLPRRLRIERDAGLPTQRVRLVASGEPMLDDDVSSPVPAGATAEVLGLVRLDNASPLAQRFEARFAEDWRPWNLTVGGRHVTDSRLLVVPRWSFPAWKALGVIVDEPGSGLAVAIWAQLLAEPQRLLAGRAPGQTVKLIADAAAAAPGAAPRSPDAAAAAALKALLPRPGGARHLALALDAVRGLDERLREQALATFTASGYFASLAHGADQTLRLPEPAPAAAAAPHKAAQKEPPAAAAEADRAYGEMQQWMPPPLQPLRVMIGSALVRAWFPDERTLPQWMEESIERERERSFEVWGVSMPGIRFRGAGEHELADPNGFKVLLFDEDESKAPEQRLPDTTPKAFEQLLGAVIARFADSRAAWVSARGVQDALDQAPEELQRWLRARFGEDALLLVARALLGTEAMPRLPLGEIGTRRLHHPVWLMGALAAWPQLEPQAGTAGEAAAFLRQLQGARLAAARAASREPLPLAAVAAAFAAGRVAQGQQLLAAELQHAPPQAVRAQFIAAYARLQLGQQAERLRQACRDAENPQGNGTELRAAIAELLEAPAASLDAAAERQLRLCRVTALSGARQADRIAEMATLARRSKPEDWSPDLARGIGETILLGHDPLRDPPDASVLGSDWLASGLERLPWAKAGEAFERLRQRCAGWAYVSVWCWQAADRVARRLTREPTVALDMAFSLSEQPPVPGAASAQDWLAESDRRIGRAPLAPAERARLRQWVRYMGLNLRIQAAEAGDAAALKALDRDLAALDDRGVAPLAANKRIHIALELLDDVDAAERLVRDALARHGEANDLLSLAMLTALRRGEPAGLEREVRRIEAAAEKKYGNERDELLMLATIGRLMHAGDAAWESTGRRYLQTNHTYTAVVAMLMHQRMAAGSARDEAEFLIRRRWRSVDPQSWKARLAAGDGSVWYEMLLGVYVKEVPPERVIRALESEQALAASEFAPIPADLAGLRADAYFYEALRRERDGDRAGATQYLQRVVGLGRRNYYEYHMARHLLATR